MEEFNLSEKIIDTNDNLDYCGIQVSDVKEFIKIIKKEIWNIMGEDMKKREKILMFIESKTGDKLT